MNMTFWMGDSPSEDKTLTDSDLTQIADRVASSLEKSFSEIVFRDEETGEEYQYSPSVENHDHFAALCKGFLASRFDVVEGV